MFLNKDQISETTRASVESQIALYTEFTSKALENFEKLVTLNLTAGRASLEEAAAASRQILGAKDPQEFMSLVAAQTRPNIDKAVSYGGHLVNIAASMQSDIGKLAEAQVSRFGQRVNGMVEEASRGTTGAPENMAAFFKSAFDRATSNYEQFTKTTRQAAEAFGAATGPAANATGAASPVPPMPQAASTVATVSKA
ncbi:MAG TPA: phasin family protein [Noviherbaspirillum sp.]|jgi:phasin family protein|uniref:phasin family protein n=1 Tax=Noviherbaspirillum sp. TaxID=1926288 RepID=UPI002F9561DB